jgi:NAD(P)-dependent dehydrogenase (short-subunit alcohol dehydrogenase family)
VLRAAGLREDTYRTSLSGPVSVALGALRERLGWIEMVPFSPRPHLGWIKPVLDTAPSDIESAMALSVVAAATVVRAVVPDMRRQGYGTLLFTTGGAAIEPQGDRAVSGIAYAAESAYTRTLAADGGYAAQGHGRRPYRPRRQARTGRGG